MSTRKMLMVMAAIAVLVLAACNGDDGEPADDEPADDPALPEDDPDAEADLGDPDDEVAQDDQAGNGRLGEVQSRGTLSCGVNDAVPGFGFLTPEGEYEGFDIDFCRVIAAGVLGDADAVEYTALTAEARFTALQAGEIDVLSRNTTWTADRDGNESGAFTQTTYYDGQGMMVRAEDGYGELADMQDTAICVLSGTTTELNLESMFSAEGINYEPLTFEDNDTLREAFLAERCDGWTSDKSQLAAFQSEWPEEEGGPDALVILEETMSKEPLGPVTLDGDQDWFDAVNWTVMVTIQAEEFGITSENIGEFMDTDPEEEPEVARLLGIDGFDPGLGLDPDFAVNIIEQVGNYGEIFDRNITEQLGLDRELNALWTEGGLMYAMPYR